MGKTRTITVTIDMETGTAAFDGAGFEDGSCAQDIGDVAKKFGHVVRQDKKPEYARPVVRTAVKERSRVMAGTLGSQTLRRR